jgi:hypothetical protein
VPWPGTIRPCGKGPEGSSRRPGKRAAPFNNNLKNISHGNTLYNV